MAYLSQNYFSTFRQLKYFIRTLNDTFNIIHVGRKSLIEYNGKRYQPKDLIALVSEKLDDIKLLQTEINQLLDKQTHCGRKILSSGRFLPSNVFNKVPRLHDKTYMDLYDLYLSLHEPILCIDGLKYLHPEWKKNINRLNFLRKIQNYYKTEELIEYSAHQPEQKSDDWLAKRIGYITASLAAVALGANKYKTRIDSLLEIVGIIAKFVGNEATDFGEKYEPVATAIYELDINKDINTKIKVYESAFIPSSDPRYFFIGGSPDGLVLEKKYTDNGNTFVSKDGYLIEIKCPLNRWPRGTVPKHYWMQMQMQMEVANLERGYFLDFKFKEFDSIVDVINYSYPYNKKGAIIEFIISETYSKSGELIKHIVRYHSPIYEYEYEDRDVYDWARNTLNEKIKKYGNPLKYKINYWILAKRHFVEVLRDRTWLHDSADELYRYWSDKHYYTHHFDELYNYLDSKAYLPYGV